MFRKQLHDCALGAGFPTGGSAADVCACSEKNFPSENDVRMLGFRNVRKTCSGNGVRGGKSKHSERIVHISRRLIGYFGEISTVML